MYNGSMGLSIQREIEIKAVTTHELNVAEVKHGETIHSKWEGCAII